MEALEKLERNRSDGVVVVRPARETMSRQRLTCYVGISEATAGAKNISMNLIVIPPASVAKPHLHKGYETAIYLLKGSVETRYGHNLERSIVSQEADLILIKPDVPHQPVNLDPKEAALAIVHATIPTSRRALCTMARRTDRRSSARFQFPELRTS